MALFGKKKEQGGEGKQAVEEVKEVTKTDVKASTGSINVEAELTRLKAQMDSFGEIRKVFGERFSRINEMIGELRGMIIETNKDLQQIQVKTTKAVDLVEAVQPDKLMTEMRKEDVRIEVLKANIESNEARMETILKELKELRNQMNVFRGIDDIVKLSEEVKKELINIKTVKSTAERHSDKIESIFIDFQKRVRELTELEDSVKDNSKNLNKLMKDFDDLKVKVIEKAEKKEVEKLITTSKEFEDHTTRAISLLNRVFVDFEEGFIEKFDKRFKDLGRLEDTLKDLTKESPHLEKNLKELEELFRKKIEEEQEKKKKEKKKTNFVKWLKSKISKKEKKEGEGGEGDEVNIEGIGSGEKEEEEEVEV